MVEHSVEENTDRRFAKLDKRLDGLSAEVADLRGQIEDQRGQMVTMDKLADFMRETFGEMPSEYRIQRGLCRVAET